MAITIDTTVSGANANSYASIAEADAYFEANVPFFPIWSAMTEAEKSARLVRAAQAIDRMTFTGDKAIDGQSMEFPRNQDDISLISPRVRNAQLEMLLHHFADQDASTGRTSGSREIASVDVNQTASVEYSNAPDRAVREACAGGSIETVIALLRPWLFDAGVQIDSTFEVVR
ncbi:hypothetical protein LLG95_05385 [bacterium]|nr:hypothetical protein [bacterium]